MWKKCKVVMLPTDGKAILGLGLSKQGVLVQYDHTVNIENDQYFQKQHLYILSDDEIKESDWYYDEENNIIDQLHKNELPMSYDEKIIASTDYSLILTTIDKDENAQFKAQTILIKGGIRSDSILSIPQSFIDIFVSEYNKGNKIEEVMVEYTYDNGAAFVPMNTLYLWLNTDNTINIKSVKDSWTRSEIDYLIRKACTDCNYEGGIDFDELDKWIESNL